MTDDEIAKALDGKLSTHMLSGLFQELTETHRNHKSPHGYENLRKLLVAFAVQPVAKKRALTTEERLILYHLIDACNMAIIVHGPAHPLYEERSRARACMRKNEYDAEEFEALRKSFYGTRGKGRP